MVVDGENMWLNICSEVGWSDWAFLRF